MNWLTTLSFAVLLLSLYSNGVQSKKHSSHASKSPWADPVKARGFMDCLIKKIEQSDVIPQQEKEDMESLVQSLMSALSEGKDRGKNSAAKLQAMNMAFASALAELVVAEDANDQAGIKLKTNALIKALRKCFKEVGLRVDNKFIHEIEDLIQMFVKEAAEEANEEEEDEFAEDYTFSVELKTTQNQGYPDGQYPDEGQFGISGSPSESSFAVTMTPARLLNALGDSQVIGTICRGMKSPAQIQIVFKSALTPALQSSLRLDRLSADSLSSIATNGMMSVPRGSSTTDYLKVLFSGPLAIKLREAGILDSPVSLKSFLQNLYGGLINIAANYGVMIPRDTADRDVLSVTNSMKTPTIGSIDISLDGLTPGGYPGGQYPDGGQYGPSGSPSDSSSGAGSSPDQLVSALGNSQVIGSICRGIKSPAQIKAVFNNALTPVLQSSLRLDSGSASSLAGMATNGLMSVPRGSSPRDYLKVLFSGPLGAKLQSAGILDSPVSLKSFLQTLLGGLINVAGNYGVMIPRDTADKDVLSVTNSMKTPTIGSIDISLDGLTPGGYPGGQYPDGGQYGPSGFPSGENGPSGSPFGSGDSSVSLSNILNARNGLKSPEANLRIKSLTSALQLAVGDDGIKPSILSSVLRASLSNLKNSGMSSDKAAIESLLELVTALVQVVASSRPDPMKSVALSSSVGLTTSIAAVLS